MEPQKTGKDRLGQFQQRVISELQKRFPKIEKPKVTLVKEDARLYAKVEFVSEDVDFNDEIKVLKKLIGDDFLFLRIAKLNSIKGPLANNSIQFYEFKKTAIVKNGAAYEFYLLSENAKNCTLN